MTQVQHEAMARLPAGPVVVLAAPNRLCVRLGGRRVAASLPLRRRGCDLGGLLRREGEGGRSVASLLGVWHSSHLARLELRNVGDDPLAVGFMYVEVSQSSDVVRDRALARVLHRVVELRLLQVNRGRRQVSRRPQRRGAPTQVLVSMAALPLDLDPHPAALPPLQLCLAV